MNTIVDTITQRKLVLVKQLFLKAEAESRYRFNISNRIMSLIGFDLTVETLLKTIISFYNDQSSLPEQFNGLIQACEDIIKKHGIEAIPYKRNLSFQHGIRNDAQHKAKYPNETDILECMIVTKDFCTDLFNQIWDINFESFSLIDLIEDKLVLKILKQSYCLISDGKYVNSLALTGTAFHQASNCLIHLMPPTSYGVNYSSFASLKQLSASEVNSALRRIENNSKKYAAMLSTGVSPVDYKTLLSYLPHITYKYLSESDKTKLEIEINTSNKEINHTSANWAINFTVNTIFLWQEMGIAPMVENDDDIVRVEELMKWEDDTIKLL